MTSIAGPLSAVRISMTMSQRLAALVAVPLVGLAVIVGSGAYSVGALDSANKAATDESAMAVHAYDLVSANERMAAATASFLHSRSASEERHFAAAAASADAAVAELAKSVLANEAHELVERVTERLKQVVTRFDAVVSTMDIVGRADDEGLTKTFITEGHAMEQLVANDLRELLGGFSEEALGIVLDLRRLEGDILRALKPNHLNKGRELTLKLKQLVDEAIVGGDAALGRIPRGAAFIKARDAYGQAREAWVAAHDELSQAVEARQVAANELGQTGRSILEKAGEMGADANARRDVLRSAMFIQVAAITIAIFLVSLIAAMLIARSVRRPLVGLRESMERLAAGDTATAIPESHGRDEIADMIRTVHVFRNNAIEREQLSAAQTDEAEARNRRANAVDAMIKSFESAAGSALSRLKDASSSLSEASDSFEAAASAMSSETAMATGAISGATESVVSAATATEELSASIGEVAGQADQSSHAAESAAAEAKATVEIMGSLASAADRIGEVVGLIQSIANQTNLLALNATIEAARAGEAGKGFAVVAAEVKSLAGQTARATEEIATQVSAIQSVSAEALSAIDRVNATIDRMNVIANTVAGAVGEQSNAVSTIAEAVNRAAGETTNGSSSMGRVAETADATRATAGMVRDLAAKLEVDAGALDDEIHHFMEQVRAA
ncbi:MAG: HAMP domain-containing methyl-accepting chemotaxis protein [Alphaproteobacteria bacterium]